MKKLKVFETFAGIGAQNKALTNIMKNKDLLKNNNIDKNKKDFEMVGTSEWYIDGIISYDSIHHGSQDTFKDYNKLKKEEMLLYIKTFSLSKDSKELYDFKKIEKLKEEKIKQLYIALKRNKNYGSILDIKGKDLPRIDLLTYSFPCFIKGTLVLTSNGYKKIEDINKNDKVLTHKNRYKKVKKPMTNIADHIYKLSTMPSEDLFVTEEHPFYVREKYFEWNNNTKKKERKFKEPIWKEIKELNKDYYVGVAINQKKKLPKWNGVQDNRYNESYKINKLSSLFKNNDFWWIVGLYIGNGCNIINELKNDYRTVIYTSKKNNMYKKIERKLRKLDINYTKVIDKNTFKYYIRSKELSIYLNQFGNYTYRKKLTNDIFDLPKNKLKKVIQGYLYDSINKDVKRYTITSVSQELIYGVGQIIAKAYNVPYSICKNKTSNTTYIKGGLVNHQDMYTIKFDLKNKLQNKSFFEDSYLWFPINDLKKQEYNGLVYNMEVEDDNSYTVNNIICHNCQDLSNAGKQGGINKEKQEQCQTRSGLLWEIERILFELKDVDKLPRFLVMENVKALLQKNHYNDWLEFETKVLEKLGYKNTTHILNSLDFGIPQSRERVFVISELNGKTNINIDKKIKENKTVGEFLNWNNKNKKIIEEQNKSIPNDTPSRRKMWEKGKQINYDSEYFQTITTKQDRHPNCGNIEYKNKEKQITKEGDELLKSQYRFITPRESLLLMGFDNIDYERLISIEMSKEEILKQAGNSIVVNVLEAIFIQILKRV